MFKRLLGSARRANRTIVTGLYSQIVAAARQPHFYSGHGVPDTPLGRFEMLSIYMVLLLERLKGEGKAASDLAQELTDLFFLDVDHSLRELGIGDMGIPKRMKKLARMFYGRAVSYREALEAGDRDALAQALQRNVVPDDNDWTGGRPMADDVFEAFHHLQGQDVENILQGRMELTADGKLSNDG